MTDMDRVRRQTGLQGELALRYTGRGVGVAVLDSGISYHPDFQGRILDFYDFVSGKHGKNECMDDYGHGTHV